MSETNSLRVPTEIEWRAMSDKQRIRFLVDAYNNHVHELKLTKQALALKEQALNETKASLEDLRHTVEKLQAEKQQKKAENIAAGRGRRKGNSTGFCRVRLSGEELNDLLVGLEELYSKRCSYITNKNSPIVKRILKLRKKIASNRDRLSAFRYEITDRGFESERVIATKREEIAQDPTLA